VRRLRRIHLHFLLALLALILARPSPATNLGGTILVAAGMAMRIWAAGALEKGGGLCTDGPYRWVRHPLYLGSFIAAVGFSVMVSRVWASLLILLAFIALYAAQTMREERRLREEFGESHAEYARQVPMLLPRPPRAAGSGRSWRFHQVRVNREHYHALVTCALVGLFHAKSYWALL
jgi:protein-S-isoprenylcysteine O-methyltransferase Ste14